MAARDPFGKHATVRIVLTYALLSALWIVASDWALEQIVADTQLLSQLQTAKGWGFVLITCTLLYGMIRNSQQSLRANYGLLQNIVEGTTDAVYVKDRRGRYVLVNSVAANILGSPADAVIGLKDRDLIPSEVARRLQATDQQIMAQGELVNLEETVPVGGQQRTYWSTKYIWRSSQGQVQGLIGISRDLTEYKRLQEERQQLIQDLQQQTEDLQALYLITANAISTLSVEELLNVLLERLLSVTAADAAVIFLSQDHSLQVRASRGLSDFQIAFYSSIVGEGFAGTVFQTGAPLYVEDVHSDVRFRGPRHEQRPTRSLLGVPLQRENHRIGVLQLEWHTVQPYQERALHLLEIIAERCTLAILNAQLFEQTQRLKERLQLQIDRMPVGCIIHDQDFRFVDWNRAAETIFGYSKAEVLGKHPSELIVPPSAQLQVNEIFKQLLGGSMTAHSTNENQTKTGRLILCHWHNTPLIDAHGNFQGLLSMVQDITEQRQTEERLKRLAYFDQVTGLPRRSLFLQRLQELIQDQQGSSIVAVLYLDIERFKVIKYSLGHRIAEALLVAIARRLESCLQPPVMISHMESDEFAVLLESIADVSEASRWADIVQAELSRPIAIEGHSVFVNAFIGIAWSANPTTEAETLLRCADIAMHRAKETGSAQAVFSHPLAEQAAAALELDADLRRALERRQLQLYYQPIVDLRQLTPVGFEALLRWHHPQRGLVGPDVFIPLAEQTGLILTIGDWVITAACRQIQQWQQRFGDRFNLTMSINLSALQLRQSDLFSTLDQTLKAHNIAPQQLKLEITESAILENAGWVYDLLTTLKSRQISIVIDDFGTGYSSLSYLHQFPFDTLKLDRSFINRLGLDPTSQEIVSTIINLAHALNMAVIAEGIETSQQLELLQQMGCDLGQGYLFSQAINSHTAEQMLNSNHSWSL